MMTWLSVGVGGALGAMARYTIALSLPVSSNSFPAATFVVNVVGSLLMGIFYVLIVEKAVIDPGLRPLVMVGFLGAFTTFSTFSIETLHLVQQGSVPLALTYVILSFLVCLLAVLVGVSLTQKLI